MPAAICAFLDSTDFESAIRLAVSLGGDSDTLACITGGIAEAYYKFIPMSIFNHVKMHLPQEFMSVVVNLASRSDFTGYICLNAVIFTLKRNIITFLSQKNKVIFLQTYIVNDVSVQYIPGILIL